MISSNIEKATLTCRAILGAVEQKIDVGLDCSTDTLIKLWWSFSASHRASSMWTDHCHFGKKWN